MASETPQPSSRSQRTQPLPASSSSKLARAGETIPGVGQFEYQATGERTPGGRGVLRPALRVVLLDREGAQATGALALVDTGADYTTLSDEWAELLGIDLEKDCTPMEVSIVDERTSTRYCYTGGLEIELVGEKLFLPTVMFCKGLPIAVLGRRDFFYRYLVLIDHRQKRFFLERMADPEEDDDDDPDLSVALVA